MKKKCYNLKKIRKSVIEIYDNKDGKIIKFVKVKDLPIKLRNFVLKTNILSFFYQNGDIIAEDKEGNEYNISDII
ncbi:MAG TPA: hypothetical protein P5250_01275 [Bacteroidales bacterium]|nr:hypothetical protein [Bacteroidales bacterium]